MYCIIYIKKGLKNNIRGEKRNVFIRINKNYKFFLNVRF